MRCEKCGGHIIFVSAYGTEPEEIKCMNCGKRYKREVISDQLSVISNSGNNGEKEGVMTDKTCLKCGKTLDVSNYSKNAATKDGLERWCKPCKREQAAELRARRRTGKKVTYSRRTRSNIPDPAIVSKKLDEGQDLLAKLKSEAYRIQVAIEVIERMQ